MTKGAITKKNKLYKKEKGFADDYIETGNGTQSALKNYDTTDYNTAGVIAHENLKKPKIQAYIADQAEKAMERIVVLSKDAKNETVQLNANKDIVDRAGFKAIERKAVVTLEVKATTPEAQKIIDEAETKLLDELIG